MRNFRRWYQYICECWLTCWAPEWCNPIYGCTAYVGPQLFLLISYIIRTFCFEPLVLLINSYLFSYFDYVLFQSVNLSHNVVQKFFFDQMCLWTCLFFDHASVFPILAKDPVRSAGCPALLSRARLVQRC